MEKAVYITGAVRTPIAKLNGAFTGLTASDLGAAAITGLLDETGVEPGAVSEVILGQVLTGGAGQNPARQSAIKAGLPISASAMTINQVCGAGQRSIHLAAQAIRCGDADIVVAGGQDSMTAAPHLLYGVRSGVRIGDAEVHELDAGRRPDRRLSSRPYGRHRRGARAALSDHPPGAGRVRHRLATEGESGDRHEDFSQEIVTVAASTRGETKFVNEDEHVNPNATLEGLARLRPVFDPSGGVTAGNSSGLNDGAAAVLVMSEREALARRMTPLARIASYASVGVEPMDMGLGPVEASRRALEKAGWRGVDLDLMEVNEAFAAQSIAVNRELLWDPDRINVNGGAIALGHPLAGSGCRIVVTLLHEMARRNAKKGLATLCVGGGQGVAICLER